MSKSRSRISIGTLVFWGFVGWFWFGDSIKGFIESDVNIKVNEKKIDIDVDEIIDVAKSKINDIRNKVDAELEKKKELKEFEAKPVKETTFNNQNSDDIFDNSDDIYGDRDSKW